MDATVATEANNRVGILLMGLLLEAALVVCWSSGFVGVRFAIDHAPVFMILLWRSLVSGLVLLPFALFVGPRIRGRDIAIQAAIGALSMSGFLAGFSLAIDAAVPTGLVALIADMVPLAVALLSAPILGETIVPRQWLGFAIGLGGVLVTSGSALRLGSAPLWAYGLPVFAMFSMALATVLQKKTGKPTMQLHQSLCIQSLAAAAIFAVFAWREGGIIPSPEPGFIIGILWLVVLATFGGYGLYYLCLRTSSAARVSSVLYLSPPVTMLWAWAMFGEPLSWIMVGGLAISLTGIIIAARAQSTRRERSAGQ